MKGVRHRGGHDPRAAALLVLADVLGGPADSQAVLDRQLAASSLVPADKALCTELVYGVLRRHLRLQWFLRQMLDKPEKLPAEMLLLLELAVYELAFTRIPAHASVNWVVSFLRNRFGRGLSGVGNGVLRRVQRNLKQEFENPAWYLGRLGLTLTGDQPESPENTNQLSVNKLNGSFTQVASQGFDGPSFLAVWHAMPEWIVRLWLETYGPEETIAYLEASARAAPFGVRVNPGPAGSGSLLNELRQESGAIFIPPAAVALPGGTRLPMRALQRSGRASRQSAAAYEALWALKPGQWETPLWDACAGRGGKSLALLEQDVSVGLVSDPSSARLKGFALDFQRLFGRLPAKLSGELSGELLSEMEGDFPAEAAPAGPEVVLAPAQVAGTGKSFPTILLDVPCSGLGTLAHRPEIRWRRSPEDLERLCASQRELLEVARNSLKKGGRIVYLTCTVNRLENEDQIDQFLARHPDFQQEYAWRTPADSPLREFFWGAVLKQQEESI